MSARGRDEPLVPFPRLTDAGGMRPAAPELWLRPFGLYESDLGVDFGSGLRPLAVTQILACCARAGTSGDRSGGDRSGGGQSGDGLVDEELLWSLPVGKRVEALVTLATAWSGGEILLPLRCPDDSCGEELEVEVTLEELAGMQDEAYGRAHASVGLDGGTLQLRRPIGIDQLLWLRAGYADELEASAAMIRSLSVGPPPEEPALTIGAMTAVEEAMEELDPLVNFTVTVRCFNCGREHPHGVDLEEIALRRLRGAQLGLLAMVHRLATRYHWSEREIFAVPHWRRSHYLSLIEREER